MMSCREVAEGISGDRFVNASWSTRFNLWIHLALCRVCRRYDRQIRALGIDAKCMCDDQPRLCDESRAQILDSCLEAARRARTEDE